MSAPAETKPLCFEFSNAVTGILADNLLHITLDNPPVNAICASIREGLMRALDLADSDVAVHAIILQGARKFFAAGADINEFDAPPIEPNLAQVTARIEASSKPVIAAINGPALGGGCEIILACHYRIAKDSAKFGLPEVKLGLIPGAGGTQRLPRLTGLATAMEMIGTGKTISAQEALQCALIDQVVENNQFEAALQQAARNTFNNAPRRTRDLARATDNADDVVKKVLAKARGQKAPHEAIRLVSLAATTPFANAVAQERSCFLSLRQSDEAKALRYVFFAERQAAKNDTLENAPPFSVKTIGIAGTGLMGSGIAVSALSGGYQVIGYEHTPEAAAQGKARIETLLLKQKQSGRLSEEASQAQLRNLSVSYDIASLATADLVIEAVFDDAAVKKELFQKLDTVLSAEAIVATNTSYLNPDALALHISNPSRVIGMHFFSPAHVMRLLEVVNCAQTSTKVLASCLAVAKKLNKLAIICGVCEGFIGNRIFSAYRREAEFMLEQGALPHEIDVALESYGFPMGLFAVCDMAGLEVAWAKRKRAAASRSPNESYCAIPDRLCEAGRLGQKSGRGWYQYPEGKRSIDHDVISIIEHERVLKKITPRHFTSAEIIEQLLYAMAQEGEALLQEGIAARSSDIDLVMINGYGFPAHKGGPMYARQRQ